MLPQAKELVMKGEKDLPATTHIIQKTLKDERYHMWSELPYYIVKMIHERIFGAAWMESIEEEEVKMVFEDYYDDGINS
jgi:hypothetical protein